jgi:TonB family protein
MNQIKDTFNTLLQRWLDGRFRVTDERSLDQMAKEDQDVKEAMEGYRQAPELNHKASLDRLKARIGNKSTENTKPISSAFGKYWLAAASLAFFIGAWYLMRSPEQANETIQIADARPKAPGETATTSNEAHITEVEAVATEDVAVTSAQDQLTQNTQKKSNLKLEDKNTQPTTTNKPTQNETTASVAVAQPQEIASAQAQDAYQTTPASKSDQAEMTSESRVSSDEKFAEGAKANKAKAREQKAQPASNDQYFKTDKVETTPIEEEVSFEPQNGWPAYDLYLKTTKNYPTEAYQKGITGSVRLAFWTDKDGNPIQIRVTRSLGYGCDEEAIRLLMEGPKWQPTNYRNGVVEMTFPR